MKYIIVVLLAIMCAGCVSNPPIDPKKVTDIQTQAGRHLPYEVKANIPTIDLNYYEDYDIGTIMSENKAMVSHWFWMWFIFTLLLCGATEFAGYLPYGVGVVFKFLGKRLSSLALACLGWLFIKYVMGGGYIYTSAVTLLALVTANFFWEIIVNWILPKIKNKK